MPARTGRGFPSRSVYTQRHAYAPSGTTFFANLAGSVTPSATESNLKVSLVSTSGAITPTGALVKKTNKILEGKTYKSHVLATPGLYNYWRLGDTSANGGGTIAIAELDRQVPLGNNGAYSGTLDTDYFLDETGALVHDSNTAVRFLSATLGRLDLYFGAFDLNVTNKVAVEVWFKWASSYSNDGCSIWQQFGPDGIEFGVTPNGADGSFLVEGSSIDGFDSAHYTRPSVDVYHHMVCVYDRGQTGIDRIKLYIDNVLQVANTSAFTTNTDNFAGNTAIVGVNPFTVSSQVLTLDELALYTDTVSQANVTDHYLAGVQGWWAAGTLLKKVNKSLSGSLTPSGTVTKQLSRSLSGTVASSGALTKRINKLLSGGVTPTGSLIKSVSKSFTGAITPAGSLFNRISKSFTGAVTPTGTVSFVKLKVISLTGAITPTGALVKQVIKSFSGSITPTGSLVKRVNKSFSGGVTPTGTVVFIKVILKSVSGAVTPTGALVNKVGKVLSGNVTPTGTLVKSISKALSGSVTPSGVVTKRLNRSLSGAITPTGTATLLKAILRSFSGNVTPSGTLTKKVNKLLSGGVTPTGTITKKVAKSFNGTVVPTGTVSTSKISAGGISLSGSVSSSGTVSLIYIAGPPVAPPVVVPPVIVVTRRARHYVQHVFSRAFRLPLPEVERREREPKIVTSSTSNLEAIGRIIGLTSNVTITSPNSLLFSVVTSMAAGININQAEKWLLAAKGDMKASGELVVVSNNAQLAVKDFDIEAEDLRILFPELKFEDQ